MGKKKAWYYQKDRYKQLSIKFKIGDHTDDMVYWYLVNKCNNRSALIKQLIMEQIWKEAYTDE